MKVVKSTIVPSTSVLRTLVTPPRLTLLSSDGRPVAMLDEARLDALARSIGARAVVMAPPAVVREATGQAIGGVAPVGHPTPLPTFIDSALQLNDVVWAAAGTPRHIFACAPADLLAASGAVIATSARRLLWLSTPLPVATSRLVSP